MTDSTQEERGGPESGGKSCSICCLPLPSVDLPCVCGGRRPVSADAWKPTHVMPSRSLHCGVCGTEEKVAYVCPEHGARCWAHVFTHEFCSHPKTIVPPAPPSADAHVCTGLCAGQSGQGKALHVFRPALNETSRRVDVERRMVVLSVPALLMV